MRVGEALSLDQQDIDLDAAVLVVRNTKNGKDRQLPVNKGTAERLASYASLRDRFTQRKSPRFFVNENSEPARDCAARYNFALVSRSIGLRSPQSFNRHGHGHGPRIHDLRHSFAVHTILDWFREGRDIECEIYKLSTYLGHSEPKFTFWYIEAAPELMQLAAVRAEQRMLEETS